MPKSVEVTFDDGSSHIYDNVPDEITNDQIAQRASQENANKSITGIELASAAPAQAPAPAEHGTAANIGLGLVHGGEAAFNLANQFLSTPVGHAVEIGGGGAYALNKAKQIFGGPQQYAPEAEPGAVNRTMGSLFSNPSQINAPGTPGSVGQGMPTAGDKWSQKVVGGMGPGGNSVTEAARNYQLQQGLNPSEASKFGVNRAGIIVPNQMAAPAAAPTAAPAPQAPPSSANYMSRMTELADRYLPAAKSAVGTVGKYVAPVARVLGSAPAMGAQMMMHSPELNANEEQELARRRQMQPTFTFPQQ